MSSNEKDASEIKLKSKISKTELKRQKVLLIIAALYVIYGIVFYYLPLAGWVMAFENFSIGKGVFKSEKAGLRWFKYLFKKNSSFPRVIRNTLAMGSLNLVSQTITAIGFAILLNEVRNTFGKKLVQTISYLPHFLSWIVVTSIVREAFATNGMVNELLVNLHILKSPISYFMHTQYFWPIVAISNVWKETGWNAIIYLATITSIDPALYEAAAIDGAGRWQKIKNITLPGLRSTIIILLIMNIGNVINAGFEIQYLLGTGVLSPVSTTIDIYVLNHGMKNFSLGTAAGIFKTFVSMIFVFTFNFIARKTGEDHLF
ncbi:MAG: sugar ABC transporter permease [Clostridiales bacterium]|nr:sugar ABC transporter permease [Clostridiales bacterium]